MEDSEYIELVFRPDVQLVCVVRRFVSRFYQRCSSDPDGISRIALATHELLENSVKYAKDAEARIRIEVKHLETPKRVSITLRNHADEQHIAALREVLDGIARSRDAPAFYQALMARKAKLRGGSGLGLARICAEGEMEITYLVEGDVVVLEATTVVG